MSVALLPGAPGVDAGYLFATVRPRLAAISLPTATLWNVDFGGATRRWFQPDPSSSFLGQKVASDGQGFLWVPDGNATLYLLSPSDPGPEMASATSVSAPGGGALVLREGVPPPLVA